MMLFGVHFSFQFNFIIKPQIICDHPEYGCHSELATSSSVTATTSNTGNSPGHESTVLPHLPCAIVNPDRISIIGNYDPNAPVNADLPVLGSRSTSTVAASSSSNCFREPVAAAIVIGTEATSTILATQLQAPSTPPQPQKPSANPYHPRRIRWFKVRRQRISSNGLTSAVLGNDGDVPHVDANRKKRRVFNLVVSALDLSSRLGSAR